VDAVLLAHPIYGANLPRIVGERLDGLVLAKGTRLSVLATFGYANALGPFREAKTLGRRIHSYFNLRMFNNLSTPKLRTDLVPLETRLGKKAGLEARLDRILERLLRGSRRLEGVGPQLLAGLAIGRLTRRGLRDNYKSLSVDGKRCTLCLRCVASCPASALAYQNGVFSFGAGCSACMRCYNSCPASAILLDGVWADPRIYTRYKGPWG
jgi:ferredoxin